MDEPGISWSSTFAFAQTRGSALPGDKIILPQSALQGLLTASTTVVETDGPGYSNFDPGNIYSVEAARRERDFWRQTHRETQQHLPTPLIFRLDNPSNGKSVYAGIREFSGEEGEVVLSDYLASSLGLSVETTAGSDDEDAGSETSMSVDAVPIMVRAEQAPKGTYVRLRPLEAGYDPDDWKALLERQLRENFTTLSMDTTLTVTGVRGEQFRFLVDKFRPEGDGICVVDTDLEVDIEALDEEQARETLRQKKATISATSAGQDIRISEAVDGRVEDGYSVDFRLPAWDSKRPLIIHLSGLEDADSLDVFASPKSARQRRKPRQDEHLFGSFGSARHGHKTLTLRPRDLENLPEAENSEALLISVHAYTSPGSSKGASKTHAFTLKVDSPDGELSEDLGDGDEPAQHSAEDEECSNCLQWVPKRTMHLHQNFCFRNNTACPRCRQVFKKNSEEWKAHWHCTVDEADGAHGNTALGERKHFDVAHTEQRCPLCPARFESLPGLARHRTTTCPGKPILCRFCHLEVPQEAPDGVDGSTEAQATTAAALLAVTGLTPHETRDGARTAECHVCGRRMRLREMTAHVAHHDLEKATRSPPPICRNGLCGRTRFGFGAQGAPLDHEQGIDGSPHGNPLRLCAMCYGPLYVAMHDPDGKALRRRVERKYLTQLMTGCGRDWCTNEWCRTGRAHRGLEALPSSAKAALPLVKPLVDALADKSEPLHLCVDEASQARKATARWLEGTEGEYWLEWYVAALEAERDNVTKAREWLQVWAPKK